MKLLMYLATPGGLTGGPRRALTLANALRDRGVDICVGSSSGSLLLAEARKAGLETVEVDPVGVLSRRRGALFRGGLMFKFRVIVTLAVHNFRFWRALRKVGADAVWVRGSKGIGFVGAGALLSRRPLVWDVDYEPASKGVVRMLHWFGLCSAKAVVFQYMLAADEIFGKRLADKYRRKFHTIVPGIDFTPLDAVMQDCAVDAATDADRPFNIIQVGTICDRKNQLHTLAALSQLGSAEFRDKLRVQFVGGVFDEGYDLDLQSLLTEAGLSELVEFLGWREDVHELIACSDLLVMPSQNEGVPNAVQEAMYLGVPVIASPAGGMRDVIIHNATGWILPLDDPGVWADRIRLCISDRDVCRAAGARARYVAVEGFGVDVWGKQYFAVIQAAVEGSGKKFLVE